MLGNKSRAQLRYSTRDQQIADYGESLLITVIRILVYNLGPFLIILALWEFFARLELIHTALFPPVTKIVRVTLHLFENGVLIQDVLSSLRRVFLSIVFGIVLGTSFGLLAGTVRRLEKWMVPPSQFLLSIPGTALFPLAILLLGLSDAAVIAALALEATVTIFFNTWTGVKSVPYVLVQAARSMGVRGLGLYRHVYIPGSLPLVVTGWRLGFGRTWRILVAGEMLAATGTGLGYRVFAAQELFRADIMYSAIIVVGVLSFLLERLILRSLETITVERWGMFAAD